MFYWEGRGDHGNFAVPLPQKDILK